MAQDKIEVIFGAEIAGLVSGVKQVESYIKGLVAPIEEVKKALSGMGEALAGAFAIEQLVEFQEKMAEIGEHAVNMGVALGISAEQFQQLSEAMSLVGASGDRVARITQMLSRESLAAMTNPLSRQADAFKQLSINAEEFARTLRTDPIEAMKQMADAAQRVGGGVEGPLGVLLPIRGDPNVYRFFSEGRKGIDELISGTHALGAPTQEALENLDKLAKSFHETGVAFTNFGIALENAQAGPLSKFLEWTSKVIADMTRIITLGSMGKPTGILEIDQPSGEPLAGPGAAGATAEEQRYLADIRRRESDNDYRNRNRTSTASGAYQMINETWRRWAAGAGIDISQYPTAADAPAAMQDLAALYGLRKEGTAPWAASASRSQLPPMGGGATATLPPVNVEASRGGTFQLPSELIKKNLDEQLKAIDEQAKAREDWLNYEIQAANKDFEIVHTLEQQKIAVAREAAEQRQALIDKTADADVRASEKNPINELIKLQTQALASDQRYNQQAVENENRLLEVRIKGINAAEQEDLKQVERRRQYGQLTVDEATQQEKQIVDAHAKAVADILAQEEKNAQGIHSILDKLSTERVQIEQQTSQKLKNIDDQRKDEAMRTQQAIAQGAAQPISGAISAVAFGRETGGQAFARAGQDILQKVMDNVTSKLIERMITNLMQQIASDVSLNSILAFLLAALNAKPSILGTTYQFGGIVPSAAGGWVIPSFQSGGTLAQLHSGEMVLPKDLSEGVQSSIRGGGGLGGGVNLTVHAWDTQTGAQALMRNSQSVAGAMRSGWMQGGTSMRGMSYGGRYP